MRDWIDRVLVILMVLTLGAAGLVLWWNRFETIPIDQPPGSFYKINRVSGKTELIMLTNQGPVIIKVDQEAQINVPARKQEE
jgi:hypothetical protein